MACKDCGAFTGRDHLCGAGQAGTIELAGRKDDQGKERPTLLPGKAYQKIANVLHAEGSSITDVVHALKRAIDVLEFGAQKYAPENWRKVENGEQRYRDAAARHILDDVLGVVLDDESGIEGLAHAIVDLMFILELRLTK